MDIGIGLVTLILFGSFIVLLILGVPIAFVLCGLPIILGYFMWGPKSLFLAVISGLGAMDQYVLVGLPMFILMGNILQKSGIADDLYQSMYLWFGRLRGGLAVGTILICTLMAAMVGVIGAGIITTGLLCLPAMYKRGYDEKIALGSVMAGGTLGMLIPPSVGMMLYAVMTQLSVGKMFMGGIFPGLVLSSAYMTYILIRSHLNPKLGPALPPEERGTFKQKVVSIRSVILPVLIIVAVLGSIFAGVATPTEAASVGVAGAILSSLVYRKLNFAVIKDSLLNTLLLFGMWMWMLVGGTLFSSFYIGMGAIDLMQGVIVGLGVSKYLVLAVLMFILFMMGMLMDEPPIIMICAPLFSPLMVSLGFDPLWFGVLFIVNLQSGFLTPPFGMALFYMKGLRPQERFETLWRATFPFVLLNLAGLAICILFPKIILWLPSMMIQ